MKKIETLKQSEEAKAMKTEIATETARRCGVIKQKVMLECQGDDVTRSQTKRGRNLVETRTRY